MERTDIPFLSVVELSRLIKERRISPVEVVTAYLDRIEELNPKLNAYVTVAREEALESAYEAETSISQGNYLGAMQGIPVAMKDQIWTKGLRTTHGSTILANYIPDEDATVVSRLREAGAIVLGKLNMSEFAAGAIFRHPYGVTHNPWNLEHQTGGSSTGSGAATAAYLCATSLGEDTGGSIRSPASLCGLVGLRPTWGRVSRYGLFPATWSLDTVGPMSRTTEDCAITLEAIAGYDSRDSYTLDIPVPHYRQALDGNIRGLKIGLVSEITNSELVTSETKMTILEAGRVLEGLGASVQEISLPLATNGYAYTIQSGLTAEFTALYPDWVKNRLEDFDYNIQVRLMVGALMPAQLYYKAQKLRALLRNQILDALKKVDVLIAPTSTGPAPKIEPGLMPSNKEDAVRHLRTPSFCTVAFALAGIPVLSVPCGFTKEGTKPLPLGLQVAGQPYAEELILKVAHAYEQSTDWHTRKPQI